MSAIQLIVAFGSIHTSPTFVCVCVRVRACLCMCAYVCVCVCVCVSRKAVAHKRWEELTSRSFEPTTSISLVRHCYDWATGVVYRSIILIWSTPRHERCVLCACRKALTRERSERFLCVSMWVCGVWCLRMCVFVCFVLVTFEWGKDRTLKAFFRVVLLKVHHDIVDSFDNKCIAVLVLLGLWNPSKVFWLLFWDNWECFILDSVLSHWTNAMCYG